MESKKCSSKENIVRKSILRNPEVPLQRNDEAIKNKRKTISNFDPQAQSTKIHTLHEPRVNKLGELRKSLNEIKNYEAKEIQSMQDVSKNTQDFINRVVSSKLNFPSNQTVFKNLPKIDGGESSQSVNKPVQKVALTKKLESKNDIQKILNELVEAEYRNEELNKKINLAQNYSDEWLGINKFKEPSFKLANQKSETQIYHEQLRKDLYNHLFSSDDYLSTKVKFNPASEAKNKNIQKSCKCMSNFYAEHSMCT